VTEKWLIKATTTTGREIHSAVHRDNTTDRQTDSVVHNTYGITN